MVLSVVHHKLDDRSRIVILCRAWLVLERVGATQGVMEDAEGAVQLRSERGELILGIIAAAEGRHGIVRLSTIDILVAAINRA